MEQEQKKIRVRITNTTGDPMDTSVVNADTGDPVPMCYSVEFKYKVGAPATAILHCWLPIVDVVVDAEIEEHPVEADANGIADLTAIGDRWGVRKRT
jgi:hypothetical protein